MVLDLAEVVPDNPFTNVARQRFTTNQQKCTSGPRNEWWMDYIKCCEPKLAEG